VSVCTHHSPPLWSHVMSDVYVGDGVSVGMGGSESAHECVHVCVCVCVCV
jgi:hypothetical protein